MVKIAECEHCQTIEKGEKIYEDEKVAVAMSTRPASRGHVLVFPKEHYTILEQVPDNIAGHMFSIANMISTKIFETLKVHGTNIILENGIVAGQKIAHVAVNVIPRSENDGMGFNWEPITVSEEDMSTAELQLKEETKNVGVSEQKKTVEIAKNFENVKEISDEKDNYLLKQLRRIP